MTAPDVAALAAALTKERMSDMPTEDATHLIAALAAQRVKLATPDSIYAALEATMIGYNTEQRKLWAEAIWEWMNG